MIQSGAATARTASRPGWAWASEPRADRILAGMSVAALGAGVVGMVAALGLRSTPLAILGAAIATSALFILILGEWLDGLLLLAIVLAAPPVLSNGDVRLPLAAVLNALVVAAWFLRRLPERRPIRLGAIPVPAVAAFMAAVVLSSLVAEDRGAALRECVNQTAMLALLVVAVDEFEWRPGAVAVVARALAYSSGVAGLAALSQALGILSTPFPMEGTPFRRATAGFGWPNEAGMYFALTLPLCVYVYQTRAKRLAALPVAGCLVGLLSTFSRSSWLGVVVAPLFLMLVGARRTAVRVWIWGAFAIVGLDFVSGGALHTRLVTTLGDWVVGQRLALMYVGILIFLANPVLGIGPGGFEQGLAQFGPQVSMLWDYVASAHNGYIEVAAEMGAIGVLSFGSLMVVILVRTLGSARATAANVEPSGFETVALKRAVAWAFATAFLIAFTIWPFAHGIGQLMILVAAMGMTRGSEVPRGEAHAPADPVVYRRGSPSGP